MQTKKLNQEEGSGFPFGRALQVGGHLTLILAVIYTLRIVVVAIVAGMAERTGILAMVNSGLSGLVQASPYLFLMSGFLSVARLGKLYEEGVVFSAGNSAYIACFGNALAWAAAAMLLIRPTVMGWIEGLSWGLSFKIDEGSMVTLVAALFVSLMAKVMQRATRLDQENQQFI